MRLRISALPLLALATSAARAADFFGDFSTTTNTATDANPWLYGTSSTAGGAITPYLDYSPTGGDGISRWSTLSQENALVPSVFKNTQVPGGVHGLPLGQAALHGGIDGTISNAAYTFPATGLYHVSGAFGAGDAGRVNEYLSLDGVVLGAYTHLDDAAGFAFSFDVAALGGQSLAFSVGIGTDGYDSDTTPLAAAIAPVPEPSALAAVALGAAAFLRRRSRTKVC